MKMKTASTTLFEHYLLRHDLHLSLPKAVIDGMKLIKLKPGERLFSQGGPHTHLYFLVEGQIEIEHYDESGGRAVFSFESAFSVLGELELFLESDKTVMTNALSIGNAVVFKLSIDLIRQYALSHPGFLTLMCKALSKKLYASASLHSTSRFSAKQKVCKYLGYLYRQHGPVFSLQNRESIAAMLGMSVRQLSRVLSELANDDVIGFKTKRVTVIDKFALR